MTENADELSQHLRRANESLRQEAKDCASSQTMIDGLLLQIYDEEDEPSRYDAAQMLTMMPDPAGRSTPVRGALITQSRREKSDEIRIMLIQKLNRLAAELNDFDVFDAIKARAESDESVVVKRWCLSGMARVHAEFVNEAKKFLVEQRALQPAFKADIEESLAALEKRSPIPVATKSTRRPFSFFRILASFVLTCAVILVVVLDVRLRAAEHSLNAERIIAQSEARQINSRDAEIAMLHSQPAGTNTGSIKPPDLADLDKIIASGIPAVDQHVREWASSPQLAGPGQSTEASAITLASPVNTYIFPGIIAFRWKSHAMFSGFKLEIDTVGGAPVTSILITSNSVGKWDALTQDFEKRKQLGNLSIAIASSGGETEWTLTGDRMNALNQNMAYRWNVRATPGAKVALTANDVSKSAIFQISNPELHADHLATARTEYSRSHLLLGAFYAKYGFIDAAAAEFDQEHGVVAATFVEQLRNHKW